MRRCRALLFITTLTIAAFLQAWQQPAPVAPSVDALGWMSGSWMTTHGGTTIEEHWTKPAGGTMIGMGRTLKGQKTAFFEYLRIEARADAIYYVAHPKARPGTDFKLVRSSAQEAVFENPQHDFPKRVIYRHNSDGSVTARVEGDPGDKEKAEEYHYQRMP